MNEIIKTRLEVAYRAGWRACRAGVDGRYMPSAKEGYETEALRFQWAAGWADAMDSEEDDEECPEPPPIYFGE